MALDSDGTVASGDGVAVGSAVGVSVDSAMAVGEGIAEGNGVGVSVAIVSSTIGVEVKVLKLTTSTVDVGIGFDSTTAEPPTKPHPNNRTGKQIKRRLRFIILMIN